MADKVARGLVLATVAVSGLGLYWQVEAGQERIANSRASADYRCDRFSSSRPHGMCYVIGYDMSDDATFKRMIDEANAKARPDQKMVYYSVSR